MKRILFLFVFALSMATANCQLSIVNCQLSWGDQGNHYIMTNRTYAQLSMFTNTRLNVEYELYRRHSSYKYYPEVHAGSHEWKIGLIYSL